MCSRISAQVNDLPGGVQAGDADREKMPSCVRCKMKLILFLCRMEHFQPATSDYFGHLGQQTKLKTKKKFKLILQTCQSTVYCLSQLLGKTSDSLSVTVWVFCYSLGVFVSHFLFYLVVSSSFVSFHSPPPPFVCL